MTLKQYLVAGVIEQVIMFGIILPATGWWFSFFALTGTLLAISEEKPISSNHSRNRSQPEFSGLFHRFNARGCFAN